MEAFEHAGGVLAYEVVGSGTSGVVLHTGSGGDRQMWRQAGYVDGLADAFRLILFDHRGHGESSLPAQLGPGSHSVGASVADVVALLDHLGLERVAFLGYSYGARVGYQLAAEHPARVAALVALGGVDGDDEDPQDWLADGRLIRAEGLAAVLGTAEPAPAWLIDNLTATDPRVVAREFESLASWSPWPLFPRIECPALIVAGAHEATLCPAAAAAIPDGRCETLPGLGHLGAYVRSDLVLAHARPFLVAHTTSS